VNWPPDPSAPLNGGAFTEGKNMRNDTFNALILRHGDRMLKDAGWPPCVDMMQIAPETMPGWSVATGSLDAAHILALVTHLCQPLTYGRAALLTRQRPAAGGNPGAAASVPGKGFMPPERLADVRHSSALCTGMADGGGM
jgi:hypothetical protein